MNAANYRKTKKRNKIVNFCLKLHKRTIKGTAERQETNENMICEITITFSKNHEMTWPCNGKTKDEAQALVEAIKVKYPEAQVTIEEKQDTFK